MWKLAAILALCATPALAEGWQVMYLADSGGSRPVQVGPNEGGWPVAYVDSGSGERLFLECQSTVGWAYDWTLKLFPDVPPMIPPEDNGTRLFVGFDDAPANRDLGPFTYVQESYWAPVGAGVAADILARESITIRGESGQAIQFTLAGARAALDQACPAP